MILLFTKYLLPLCGLSCGLALLSESSCTQRQRGRSILLSARGTYTRAFHSKFQCCQGAGQTAPPFSQLIDAWTAPVTEPTSTSSLFLGITHHQIQPSSHISNRYRTCQCNKTFQSISSLAFIQLLCGTDYSSRSTQGPILQKVVIDQKFQTTILIG